MTDITIARNKLKQNPSPQENPTSKLAGMQPPVLPIAKEVAPDLEKTREVWDKVIRTIIYALAFFLPVLFTPWTFEPLEFSKQMLLFLLTSAAATALVLKLLVF